MSERNMGELRCELRNAESLEELRDIINELDAEHFAAVENDISDLPTFGGEWPKKTRGVFSWDHERLLVFAGEFEIVDRKTIAVCEGDEIVIRMPVERLTRLLENAVQHDRNIEVLDRDELIEEVLSQINTGTGKEMTAAESFFVESAMFALDDGSTALRETSASAKAA